MNSKKKSINASYKPPEKRYWEGRRSNPDLGNQYWYQQIELLNANSLKHPLDEKSTIDIALLGYVCDEGVRRNHGRIGAQDGPKAIRERLAKLPVHFESKRIVDFGDIICIDGDMEACQKRFSNLISRLIQQNILPIALGGGHDMAFGNFMGIWDAVKSSEKKKIAIINFDAHFDLRPVDKKSNSGTPFNQIIAEFKKKNKTIDYFAIGIQQQSNTKELFDIAKNENVIYITNDDCEPNAFELENLKNKLKPIISRNDYLYITIDLDGFSSAYAPGVSAPSPLGFTPNFVFKMLSFLLKTKKVISVDIAELNPSLDRDNLTAILSARIVDYMVMNYIP